MITLALPAVDLLEELCVSEGHVVYSSIGQYDKCVREHSGPLLSGQSLSILPIVRSALFAFPTTARLELNGQTVLEVARPVLLDEMFVSLFLRSHAYIVCARYFQDLALVWHVELRRTASREQRY